jgi:hypothetical protein
MKKMFAVTMLALCSLFVLSAGPKTQSTKSYEISFSSNTKVGSTTLKPGDYSVKASGDNAIFTQTETGKQFTVPVKQESGDKKFDDTHVNAVKEGDVQVVNEIELAGSKTKLEFSK